MNQFEEKMNALRIQFRNERVQIHEDSNRTLAELDTAIRTVNSPEARKALRREKARVYHATCRSMKYNRLCYRQQLEDLEEEYRLHLEKTPSNHQIRRMMGQLRNYAESKGTKTLSLYFGDNHRGEITFD